MKIVHVSDLHFGCADDEVRDALKARIVAEAPDLVIASGDITQSATDIEFAEASIFFESLPAPLFAVPGNHDLPGMDLMRFIDPWGRYRRHIGRNMEPEFRAPCVHVKGINSARMILPHWNWANGSISGRQRRDIARAFAGSDASWRVFVLHHPPMNTREFPLDVSLFHREALLATLSEQRVDVVLAGHQHHAYIETRVVGDHTTVFVNASTAMSQRVRRQPQGFNILSFSDAAVRIDLLRYAGGAFSIFEAITHTRA